MVHLILGLRLADKLRAGSLELFREKCRFHSVRYGELKLISLAGEKTAIENLLKEIKPNLTNDDIDKIPKLTRAEVEAHLPFKLYTMAHAEHKVELNRGMIFMFEIYPFVFVEDKMSKEGKEIG